MNFSTVRSKEITIPIEIVSLKGDLTIPEGAKSIIIFSHGSGSSRLSSRNRLVAEKLNSAGFATLLFDLLTPEEDKNHNNRFDIELLTQRLLLVTNWIKENEETKELSVGYFGASTGAASALAAASMLGDLIKAVVSRGGRPELASPYLPEVKAPVLMIVGGMDYYVIESNEAAFLLLNSEKQVLVVEDATHLFEEPSKLEEVAGHSIDWFKKYMEVEVR